MEAACTCQMKGYLTGHDLANTVKMLHTQWRVAFLLVEGVTDAALFKAFVHLELRSLWCATGGRMHCSQPRYSTRLARPDF